jgi:hypothetical protein
MIRTNVRSFLVGLVLVLLSVAGLAPSASAINSAIMLLPPGQSTEVTVASNSSSVGLQRPRMNDLGEIVWSLPRVVGGAIGDYVDVFSNLRGQITSNSFATGPDINNLGEIIWRFGDGAGANGISSSVRGTVLVGESNGIDPYYDTPRINNNREIIAGRSGSPEWVWSNVRGHVANSPSFSARETEVNDSGEVV